MNTIILIIIVVILVCIAIVTFLLLRRRGRKRQHMDMLEPIAKSLGSHMDMLELIEEIKKSRAHMAMPKPIEEIEESLAHMAMPEPIETPSASMRLNKRKMDKGEMPEPEMAEAETKSAAKRESFKQKYKISVAHPRLLSKGYASLFVVQIYLPSLRPQAKRVIMKDLPTRKVTEHLRDIELEEGLKVRIKLSSPVLSFSDPVIKHIENGLATTYFTAIPSDNCRSGSHSVVLSVVDIETQVEYLSTSLNVRVVDFAFDHVSRPFLSKAMSVVLGLGSLTMFVLTALEQVDKTFGLTAGTAAAVLTSTILVQWWSIFHRPAITHTP